jgi:hypothetical protein
LVDHVDDGQKLLDRLGADGFNVAAAFWVKAADEEIWHLYIASPLVDPQRIGDAYRAVYTSLSVLGETWVTLSDVKLVRPDHPLAQAAAELQRRYPGPGAVRSKRSRVADFRMEEMYVYPPGPKDERWRGIDVKVMNDAQEEDAFRVEFWPRELQAPRGPGGEFHRVPRSAAVRVKGDHVIDFRPPEKPLPHLTQKDYEEKALEAVKSEGANPF